MWKLNHLIQFPYDNFRDLLKESGNKRKNLCKAQKFFQIHHFIVQKMNLLKQALKLPVQPFLFPEMMLFRPALKAKEQASGLVLKQVLSLQKTA